jgi:hypothetical protein
MSDKKLLCELCKKSVANTPNVLARHVRSMHSVEWRDYVVKFQYGGKWPTCACGCGKELQWKKGGFPKYAKDHDMNMRPIEKIKFSGPGWVANPFTGKEEHIATDDELALFELCIERNDPITHDHGLKVGWEDASGKLRILVPSFKHLNKDLILVIDKIESVGFELRVGGLKSWCDDHGFMLLVLKRDGNDFFVIEAHSGKRA